MSSINISSIKNINEEPKTNASTIRDTNDDKKIQMFKNELMCTINHKFNYIDYPKLSYGYLIMQKEDKVKNKIDIYPIPELLCEKGYKQSQEIKQKCKLDYYYNIKEQYNKNNYINYWLPIYINEIHYIKNKENIINTLKKIKCGDKDNNEDNDDKVLEPEIIFEIMPLILNKILNGMLNKKNEISTEFTKCFFQFILLLKKLINEYEDDLIKYLNHKLNLIYKSNYNVKKAIIPNIENFILLLLLSNKNIHNKKMNDMWYYIYEEYVTRQIYWMFNNKGQIKDILENIQLGYKFKNSNKVYYIEDETLKECLRKGNCMAKIKDNKCFINTLKTNEIYDEILDCFLTGIFDKKYLKEKIDLQLKENFQNTFNNSTINIRRKVINKLINNDEEYYEYFKLNNDGKEIYEEEFSYKPLILNYKIRQLLFNEKYQEYLDEFGEIAYKSQKSNKLIILIYYMEKVIKEKGFIEELEQNYGIYLNADNLMKEMKQKVNEVENYAQMFEYVQSEYGKNQSDIELIKYAYDNAKWKKYI